ncbi:Putative pyridoxal phosphate-dependent aminotransferase EpsN [Roseibium album]|nr:Putative pyridoxal phosphate-dependent aminotransferase EpsN [Roseibium album]
MADLIPVAGPWITQREVDYAADAAANAWNENHNIYNTRFETAFADYVGVKHAVSLPHCTAGIHLSLAAFGIGPGDEVIVPEVTWIASVAPVVYVGAEPVFADIDPVTWCLDPASVEACLTDRTKAIIGVDLYGSMADWTQLRKIAEARNLYLLEDAAEAVGSRLDGLAAGSFGDTGVFSFHGSKSLVTGEGGMLVTDDEEVYVRVMSLRDHGRPPKDRFFLNQEVGFKYKMSALQAAVGLAQVERIDELIEKKRQIFNWYADQLGERSDIWLNAEPENVHNSYWMVTIVTEAAIGLNKFQLMKALETRGIDSRPFFSRLSQIPAFADRPESARFLPEVPQGANAAEYGVNLPSGYGMTEEKVARVVSALNEILV